MSQDFSVPLSKLAPDQDVMALPGAGIEDVMQRGLADCFTAAQVVVCQDGQVLWHRAYGVADLTMLFDLASVTKLFTVTAFLALSGEGRVMLTLPVADVIPEFATVNVNEDGLRPVGEMHDPLSWSVLPTEEAHIGKMVNPREVTFRHLLTHTSGLAPWSNLFEQIGSVPPPEGVTDAAERMRRHQRAVEFISSNPFAGPPDSGIRYSDQGLILLGEATARLHALSKGGGHVPLDAAIRARVLEPLGLQSTRFNPVPAGVSLKDVAPTEFDARWRRRRVHGEVHDENAAAMGGVAGHAGLFSTAREVAIFGQAWLDRIMGKSSPLPVPSDLAREAVRIQEAEGDARRGLGWMLKATCENSSAGAHMSLKTFGHTGFTGTSLFIDPERALVVASLNNRVYHGRSPELITAFRPALHDAIVGAVEAIATPSG
ncbi:MAG: serine hydrolase [Anaerolineae bacterium]|nr:serine hydrolase [Anaerolineae bacterium]